MISRLVYAVSAILGFCFLSIPVYAVATGVPTLTTVDPLTVPAPVAMSVMTFEADLRKPVEKIQPMLWQEALKRGSQGVLSIIVTLQEPILSEALSGATAAADASRVQWVATLAHQFAPLATAAGMDDLRAISHFPILFGKAKAADLEKIAALPHVRAVELDAPVVGLRVQGGGLMNSPTLRNSLGGDGEGVEVAVIDSGVFAHNEFAARIRAQQDLTGTTGDGTVDGSGHGTSVAGIIAGSGGGMAPAAGLWAMKVLLNDGTGLAQWTIDALNSVYANRAGFGGLDLVNLSLGIPGQVFNADCDASFPAYATAVNQLVAAGIPVFAASGNDGSLVGVQAPACLANVVAVGAVTDAAFNPDPLCGGSVTADAIACYSNSGLPLDILAPSHCSSTTAPNNGVNSCFNGTSAAAPYAVGVAAQILSLLPATTPAQLRTALMTTGRPRTDVNGITRNRIDAVQAYQALTGGSGGGCVDGPNTACILGERFKVEISWTDFQGTTRAANVASAGTPDSALFYFGNNVNNWEFLIKAVNACSFNSKYWIFFAAATNVGYTVTVTDTQAGGAPKVYSNPVGNLAQAVNDISAFSCP